LPMQPVYRAIAANLPLIRPFGPPSVYALRAAFGGCAPTRTCGRSPLEKAFHCRHVHHKYLVFVTKYRLNSRFGSCIRR